MNRRVLVAVTLVVGAVLLTAAPSGASRKDDKQLARIGVLVVSDFPAGWTQSPRGPSSDASTQAAAAEISACKPFLAFSKANKKNPRAQSPNFDHDDANVTNAVSVYRSEAAAIAAMRTFADPRLTDCLDRLFTSTFRRQLEHDDRVAGRLRSVDTQIAPLPEVRIGDEAVAYQGTVEVVVKGGRTQTVALGVASARVGRAVVGYSWTSSSDISAALQPAVVRSVSRVQAAGSGS